MWGESSNAFSFVFSFGCEVYPTMHGCKCLAFFLNKERTWDLISRKDVRKTRQNIE